MNDVVQRMVERLREAGVHLPYEWPLPPSGSVSRVEMVPIPNSHPLSVLWASQDARGVEQGLTVPCPADVMRHDVIVASFEHAPGLTEFRPKEKRSYDWEYQCATCHGTGRVARSLDGLSEGMIRGFVEDLCASVGWRLVSYYGGKWGVDDLQGQLSFDGDTPLEAMDAAIEKVTSDG